MVRVSPPKPNQNVPPAKATGTEAPATGDDLGIPTFLRRDPDDQVGADCANDAAALPVVAGSPSDTPLRIFEDAKRRLAAAKTVDEAKSIRDIAMGLAEYARQASDHQLEADAAAIHAEAVRVIGLLMLKQKAGFAKPQFLISYPHWQRPASTRTSQKRRALLRR
jgi:hypothetical protein